VSSFIPYLAFVLLTAVALQSHAVETKQMQPVPGNVVAPQTQFSDGKRLIALSAFKGKYVLANFWATWCLPCVREMPALDRLAAKLEKQGVVIVAISQDEGGPAQVRPFAEKLKLSKVKILYDTDKRGFRDYALRGLPTTVLISPQGILLARLEGSAAWDEGALVAQVENLTNK
jgi:thiol-disulfide isomerase/thioredoxin